MSLSAQTLDHWQPLKFHISQCRIHIGFYAEVSPRPVRSIPSLAVGPVEIPSHTEPPPSTYSLFLFFFFFKSCEGTCHLKKKKKTCVFHFQLEGVLWQMESFFNPSCHPQLLLSATTLQFLTYFSQKCLG